MIVTRSAARVTSRKLCAISAPDTDTLDPDKLAQHIQQPIRLVLGKNGGRLIKNDHARAGDQNFEESLDALLLCERQAVNRSLRVDREAELGGKATDFGC